MCIDSVSELQNNDLFCRMTLKGLIRLWKMDPASVLYYVLTYVTLLDVQLSISSILM